MHYKCISIQCIPFLIPNYFLHKTKKLSQKIKTKVKIFRFPLHVVTNTSVDLRGFDTNFVGCKLVVVGSLKGN